MSAPRRRLVLLGEAALTALTQCKQRPEFADWTLEALSTPDAGFSPADWANGTKLLLLSPHHTHTSNTSLIAEAGFRAQLLQSGSAYSVVYPDDDGWLHGVLHACGHAPRPERQTLRRWACDACSDPDCEHRLFQDLLARRPG